MADRLVDVFRGSILGEWRLMLPLLVATLLIGSSAVLLQTDLDRLPKVPWQRHGRTWRLEGHGAVAYGTFSEAASVCSLLVTGFAVGAFGLGHGWSKSAVLDYGETTFWQVVVLGKDALSGWSEQLNLLTTPFQGTARIMTVSQLTNS